MSNFFTITLEAYCADAKVDFGDVIGRGAAFELRRGLESLVVHAERATGCTEKKGRDSLSVARVSTNYQARQRVLLWNPTRGT